MRDSSKRILGGSSNPAISDFVDESLEEVDYSRHIPVAKYKNRDGLLKLDLTSTSRIMIFGPSGSGKTILGNAVLSRLERTGRSIVNLADVKNDYQSWNYKGGASKQHIEEMGLAKNEDPASVETEVWSPKFLLDEKDDVPSWVTPFSYGFQDVSKSELRFLMGGGSMSQNIKALWNETVSDLDLQDASFDGLMERIDEIQEETEFNPGTVNSLKSNIRGLESSNVVSNRFRKDPLTAIREGKALSLGLEGWRNFQRGEMFKLMFYVSVLLRKIKQEARSGGLEPGFGFHLPEAHKVAPAGEDSLVKQELNDLFTQAQRQIDAPVVLDSQNPSQLPNSGVSGMFNFIGQATDLFLGCDQNGRPLGENEWSKVLKSVNLLTRSNRDEWRSRIRSLERFDFLYVSPGRHDGPFDPPVVRSLAPLVRHSG